jgi:hypothetical protein
LAHCRSRNAGQIIARREVFVIERVSKIAIPFFIALFLIILGGTMNRREEAQLSLNLTLESGAWIPASPFGILIELTNHGEAIEVVDLDSWSEAWALGVVDGDSSPRWYTGLDAWKSYFGPGSTDEMIQMRRLDTNESHSLRLELGNFIPGLDVGEYRLIARYRFGDMRVVSNEAGFSVPDIKTELMDCTINAAYENLLQHVWSYSHGERTSNCLRSGNAFYPLGQRYVSRLASLTPTSTLYIAQQAFAAQTYGETPIYAIVWISRDSNGLGARFIDSNGKTIDEFSVSRTGLNQSDMLHPLQYEGKRVIIPFLNVRPDRSLIRWSEMGPGNTLINLNEWSLPSKAEKLDIFAANNGNIGLAWFDREKGSILAFHDTIEGKPSQPISLMDDLREDEDVAYLKVKNSWGNLTVKAIIYDRKEKRLKAKVFNSPDVEENEETDWISIPDAIQQASCAFDHDPMAGFMIVLQDTRGRFHVQSPPTPDWETLTQVPSAAKYDVSLTTRGGILWAFHENVGLRFYQIILSPLTE